MVHVLPFFCVVSFFSGRAYALSRLDSAIGSEVGASAPNGTVMSDISELHSQTETKTTPPAHNHGGYGGTSTTIVVPPSTKMPIYRSGSSNWGNTGHDDCVSQCRAKYGAPMAPYYQPTETVPSGNGGQSVTHTVIVAPTQGVLRYIPFAVNASVGDVIKFMWGANNHTVTKSSALLPCNKTSNHFFASGTRNKGFIFTQAVNDTNPTYYYCGTPTHCQKGMFGIINPPSAYGAATSFSTMAQSIGTANLEVGTYSSITQQNCANNTAAGGWGSNIDLAQLPTWAHAPVAENILFTRNLLASNPEVLRENGRIDLSTSQSTPLMIPPDVAAALRGYPTPSGTSPSVSPSQLTSGITSATASNTTVSAGQSSGAGSLVSPRSLVGLAALATLFTL